MDVAVIVVIPRRTGSFSTLPFDKLRTGCGLPSVVVSLSNHGFALRQFSRRPFRCAHRVPRKTSDVRSLDHDSTAFVEHDRKQVTPECAVSMWM
ncbi:MAG: hypothetical protein LLG97_18465 [Deltaproteobacteria bacterium]|nr:hypothetical protein [Deltaproteobacteria bacterium]